MQKNLDVVGKSQRFVTSLGCMGPKWLQVAHEPPEIECKMLCVSSCVHFLLGRWFVAFIKCLKGFGFLQKRLRTNVAGDEVSCEWILNRREIW